MNIKKMLVAAAVIFLGFSFFQIAIAQNETAFNPQSLIGEWIGRWSNQYGDGKFYMTIKKVEEEKIYGTVYTQGPAQYHNRDRSFTGTIDLKNMILSGTTTNSNFSFTIVNNRRMEGWASGTVKSDIWLEKKN